MENRKSVIIYVLLFVIIGMAFILSAVFIKKTYAHLEYTEIFYLIIKDFGIFFLVTATMTAIYEYWLRNQILKHTNESLRKTMEEVNPSYIERLKKSGIVEAFEMLHPDDISKEIKQIESNSEIRILKFWINGIEQIEPYIINAIIQKNCRVKICVIVNDINIIVKRSNELGRDEEITLSKVKENYKSFERIKNALKKVNKEHLLEIRSHYGQTSVSLFGVNDIYFAGFYFADRFVGNGMQFRVAKTINGKDTTGFYKEIDNHFNYMWDWEVRQRDKM